VRARGLTVLSIGIGSREYFDFNDNFIVVAIALAFFHFEGGLDVVVWASVWGFEAFTFFSVDIGATSTPTFAII